MLQEFKTTGRVTMTDNSMILGEKVDRRIRALYDENKEVYRMCIRMCIDVKLEVKISFEMYTCTSSGINMESMLPNS